MHVQFLLTLVSKGRPERRVERIEGSIVKMEKSLEKILEKGRTGAGFIVHIKEGEPHIKEGEPQENDNFMVSPYCNLATQFRSLESHSVNVRYRFIVTSCFSIIDKYCEALIGILAIRGL